MAGCVGAHQHARRSVNRSLEILRWGWSPPCCSCGSRPPSSAESSPIANFCSRDGRVRRVPSATGRASFRPASPPLHRVAAARDRPCFQRAPERRRAPAMAATSATGRRDNPRDITRPGSKLEAVPFVNRIPPALAERLSANDGRSPSALRPESPSLPCSTTPRQAGARLFLSTVRKNAVLARGGSAEGIVSGVGRRPWRPMVDNLSVVDPPGRRLRPPGGGRKRRPCLSALLRHRGAGADAHPASAVGPWGRVANARIPCPLFPPRLRPRPVGRPSATDRPAIVAAPVSVNSGVVIGRHAHTSRLLHVNVSGVDRKHDVPVPRPTTWSIGTGRIFSGACRRDGAFVGAGAVLVPERARRAANSIWARRPSWSGTGPANSVRRGHPCRTDPHGHPPGYGDVRLSPP